MSKSKGTKGSAGTAPPDRRDRRLSKMTEMLSGLARGLPRLDLKAVERVVKEVKTYPTAALRILFKRLGGEDPAMQAVVERVLASRKAADVVDNLKATVFDVTASDVLKVRANELLAELDTAVDPEVLEMSVPKAAQLAANLPGRAYEALAAGRMDDAVARFRRLPQPHQAVLIYRIAANLPGRAAEFFRRIAADGEYIQEALLWAAGSCALADAAPLAVEMAASGSKAVQKAAKRVLFELKAAGVAVPELPKPRPAEEQAEPGDGELPLHSVRLGESKEGDLKFVSVARVRPDGRLKVLIMLIDVWHGGVRMAAYRSDASKSAYDRAVRNTPEGLTVRPADLSEARRVAAAGVAASKALGTRIPLDYQLGRSLLGPVDQEVGTFGAPFRCAGCGAALGEEVVQQVRDAMVYAHVKVERRCRSCREAEKK